MFLCYSSSPVSMVFLNIPVKFLASVYLVLKNCWDDLGCWGAERDYEENFFLPYFPFLSVTLTKLQRFYMLIFWPLTEAHVDVRYIEIEWGPKRLRFAILVCSQFFIRRSKQKVEESFCFPSSLIGESRLCFCLADPTFSFFCDFVTN